MKASENKIKPVESLNDLGFAHLGKRIMDLKTSIDSNINNFESTGRTRELEVKLKEALSMNSQLSGVLEQQEKSKTEKVLNF